MKRDNAQEPVTEEPVIAAAQALDAPWAKQIEKLLQETTRGALSAKVACLVKLAINASPTCRDEVQIRRHTSNALAEGATPAEVLAVLKLSTVIPIHCFAVAAPILHGCLTAATVKADDEESAPYVRALRKRGDFNVAWEHIYQWEPQWLDCFLAVGLAPWDDGVLDSATLELLCIAFDVAVSHMYSPGTERHIQKALQLGVPLDQILEVIKIASMQALQSVEPSLKILHEEVACREIQHGDELSRIHD
ncbi:MAG: carboxymuconolactone decarboxylase family protein [Burkholderiaceae bacterium]